MNQTDRLVWKLFKNDLKQRKYPAAKAGYCNKLEDIPDDVYKYYFDEAEEIMENDI